MRGHAPIIHPVRLVDGALTLNDVIDILRHCIYSGTKQVCVDLKLSINKCDLKAYLTDSLNDFISSSSLKDVIY